tara:strand:- start:504 stop:1229 length:726 start_codon:yes stop_codon:yes gene_type:complete
MAQQTKKVAVVTGAGGAIGQAVCQRLMRDDIEIVAVDVSQSALIELEKSVDVRTYCLDLGDLKALPVALADIGRVDILVNNAGLLNNDKVMTQSLPDWHQLFRVNLDAAFLLIKMFLPAMAERKWGRIINMSSYAAKCGGLTAGTAYTTSKAALIGLTFSVAREFAGSGITANAVAPAYVMSPMVSGQLSAEQRADLLKAIPVGRFCTPEEVAHTVAFLTSPLAGFITGEVVDMNGGLQFD